MGLTGGAAFAGYDPVVSSEQSDAQRQARMQAFRATMREAQEPTTSRSARVFPGDFILASHDSGGVDHLPSWDFRLLPSRSLLFRGHFSPLQKRRH
eukprot:scaffold1556_cov125-Isochrysis_galbana.AAC.1